MKILEKNPDAVLKEMETGKSISEVAAVFGVTKEACLRFRNIRGMKPLGIYPRHSQEERMAKSLRMKGHIVSEETRRKISEAHSGRLLPRERVEAQMASMIRNGRRGPRTIETRMKMSESHKALGWRGEKNPAWKGGVSKKNLEVRHSIQMRLWREAVLSRDNFTCQECGVRGGRLHAHHIKPFSCFPEFRFAIDNGKTMCISCHGLFHGKNFLGLYSKTKSTP